MIACFLTAIIYYGQLLWGMKSYQQHMLDAYKGKFIFFFFSLKKKLNVFVFQRNFY
jgi:hypothetical protein